MTDVLLRADVMFTILLKHVGISMSGNVFFFFITTFHKYVSTWNLLLHVKRFQFRKVNSKSHLLHECKNGRV